MADQQTTKSDTKLAQAEFVFAVILFLVATIAVGLLLYSPARRRRLMTGLLPGFC